MSSDWEKYFVENKVKDTRKNMRFYSVFAGVKCTMSQQMAFDKANELL